MDKFNKVNKLKQYEFSNNSGQIIIASDNSTINANQYFDNMSLNGIDIVKLKEELTILKSKLAEKELYLEAVFVKNAIDAKDKSKILKFLKSAGQKSMEIAKESVLLIAAETIKKSIGNRYTPF